MKVPITIIIHALNEEVNLPYTLNNVVGWADQVWLVDSESSDRTVEIAKTYGVDIVLRKCVRKGLVDQRNWALSNLEINNEWVFILDADETMTEEIKEEVKKIVLDPPSNKDGYYCRYKNYFLGQWIKRSSMYPTWTLRLFRRKIRYETRGVNSYPIVEKGREGYLKEHIINEDRKGFSAYVTRMDEFSTLESLEYVKVQKGEDKRATKQIQGKLFGGTVAERRRYLKNLYIKMPFKPVLIFVYLYIIRLGVFDGRVGFDFCFYKAIQEWIVLVKIRENLKEMETHGKKVLEVEASQ